MLMRQKQCKQTDSHVRAVNPRDRARQSLVQQACKNKTWTMNCRIMRSLDDADQRYFRGIFMAQKFKNSRYCVHIFLIKWYQIA